MVFYRFKKRPRQQIKTIWKLSVPIPWVIMSFFLSLRVLMYNSHLHLSTSTSTHLCLLICAVRNLKITKNKDWHMIWRSHGILLVWATTLISVPKVFSLQRLYINNHKGEWIVSPNGDCVPVEIQSSRSLRRYFDLIYVELDVCECV